VTLHVKMTDDDGVFVDEDLAEDVDEIVVQVALHTALREQRLAAGKTVHLEMTCDGEPDIHWTWDTDNVQFITSHSDAAHRTFTLLGLREGVNDG
jgi:hypothetical protein